VPYPPFADRVWELRASVSAYDAWYVAVAEELACPLATLDARLSRAAGPRCAFELPR
jgi:predicted nucleic acid-binding protein